ncbi:uncharacterized protein LOC120147330 [Hibiscus syriacus]|uniref:uncharacterized protein LOC120147330 n=1 Tax=Hibiscus syriacus TaxID=106335 RepID=UPI001923EB67|nr:uncharacterized protein LOC120147330 [Hibiscus syriacus]
MIPEQWASPCGNQCTHKYAALMQIPWRVFCKKGCSADGETWEECLSECDEICYKDPVLKDQKWSAYMDRSPGATNYSQVLNLIAIFYPIFSPVMTLIFFSFVSYFFMSDMVNLLLTWYELLYVFHV